MLIRRIVSPLIASVGVGLSVASVFPTTNSVLSAQETDPKGLKQAEEYQSKKLKELASLPDERLQEVEKGLKELREYLGRKVRSDHYHRTSDFEYLIKAGKKEIEVLLSRSMKLITSDDPPKQKIGLTNLNAINGLYYTSGSTKIGDIINGKDYALPFFESLIKNPPKDLERTKLSIDAGFTLFDITRNDKSCAGKFLECLSKQMDYEANAKEKNKEKAEYVEGKVNYILQWTHYYFLNYPSEKKIEITQPLLSSYTKLLEQNRGNPSMLTNGFNILSQFGSLYYGGIKNSAYESSLTELGCLLIDGVGNLPNPKKKKELASSVFNIPYTFNARYYPLEYQDRLVKSLSRGYFTDPKDKEPFSNFMNSNKLPANIGGVLISYWNPYISLKLIDGNQTYFKEVANSIIEEEKRKLANKDSEENARKGLINLYAYFRDLPYAKVGYSETSKVESYSELRFKVDEWLSANIRGPIFNEFLAPLQNQNVKISVSDQFERDIDDRVWRDFNESLSKLITSNFSDGSVFANAVSERLKNEKSPYNREMAYTTLGLGLNTKVSIEKVQVIVDLLKAGIAIESKHEAVRGIGKSLGTALESEQLRQSPLFQGIVKRNEAEAFSFKEANYKELTPTHALLTDCARILDGEIDLIKSYLPSCTFEVTKDRKLKNPSDLDAVIQLRKNAYLILAYSALQSGDSLYRQNMEKYLEKRFEKYASIERLGEVWGEQALALVELYRAHGITLVENQEYVKGKLAHLNRILFTGRETVHEIEGQKRGFKIDPLFGNLRESLAMNALSRQGKSWHNLDEGEREEVLRSDEVRSKYYKARTGFAKRMFQFAPHQSVREYVGFLAEIGRGFHYSSNELPYLLQEAMKES